MSGALGANAQRSNTRNRAASLEFERCHVSRRKPLKPMAAASTVPELTPMARGICIAKTYAIGALDTFGNVLENVSGRLGWQLVTPRVCTAPLTGKVCIVTGANAGIGLATAELLAARGAHVIMACRSRQRGEAAASELRERCALLPGCGTTPSLEVMEVDMASLSSVRSFCSTFNSRHQPLHLLVANAGIMSPASRLETQDGLEMQFQVNFLSHWLMAHQLLGEQRNRRAARQPTDTQRAHKPSGTQPSLASISLTATAGQGKTEVGNVTAASGKGGIPGWGLVEDGTRVVMVSSLTHYAGPLNWHDMQSRTSYDPFTSYALSKMANAMTAVELQRRIDRHAAGEAGSGSGVWGASKDSVVAVHPGVVDTYLANNFFKTQGLVAAWPASRRFVGGLVDMVGPLLMKTTAASAAVMGCAMLAPAKQVAGRYLVNGHPAPPASEVHNPRLSAQLWDVAQQLTGLTIHESLS